MVLFFSGDFRGNRRFWTLFLLAGILVCRKATADDDYDYVQQVLDEHEDHYNDYYGETDELHEQEMRRQLEQEEERLQRREELKREQEQLQKEEEERIRKQRQREREEAFEAELQQMSAEKQKAAKRQKRKDTRIVKRVLKAFQHERYYAVLGLRNWEISIPSTTIPIPKASFTLPGFRLFHVSAAKIKKAYREKVRKPSMLNTCFPNFLSLSRTLALLLNVQGETYSSG
jgi:hypothetical protein